MECLVKYIYENFITDLYSPHNSVSTTQWTKDNAKKNKRLFWSKYESLKGEETYLLNYANKLTRVYLERNTILVEKDETKVSLKFFSYTKERRVGVHYFIKKQVVSYLTFNKKTNILYYGAVNGKKTKVHSNPFWGSQLNSFFEIIYNLIKNYNYYDESGTLVDPQIHLFHLVKTFITECIGDEYVEPNRLKLDVKSIFLRNFFKQNNISYPDNYEVFYWYKPPTLRQIKRAKNSLLLAVEKMYKIKGKKFHRVLHQLKQFSPEFVKFLVYFFGVERLQHTQDSSLVNLFSTMNYNTVHYTEPFTEAEKNKMYAILLDCVDNNGSLYTYFEHINYLIRLRNEFGETSLVWKSKTREEFTKEHVEFSNKIAKYSDGVYDRTYSEDFIKSFDTQFVSGGGVYYPVLFTKQEQYVNESDVQSNCVKTYVQNINCFILSLREGSPDSGSRATIQYVIRHNNNKIYFERSQTLGRFNQKLPDTWNGAIELLDNMVQEIKTKFVVDDFKIIKTNFQGESIFNVLMNEEHHNFILELKQENNKKRFEDSFELPGFDLTFV